MFSFEALNEQTRQLMLREVEQDIKNDSLYMSPRLTAYGLKKWPDALRHACSQGDEDTLAYALAESNMIEVWEMRRNKKTRVPENAHETLAGGEFNKFYIRALCLIAMDSGQDVQIYRAKEVRKASAASSRLIGTLIEPSTLLDNLRAKMGINKALGVPRGPNAGLSVRLVEQPAEIDTKRV